MRLVLTVLGEAERFGAVCANRVDVTALLMHDGRAEGVVAVDTESGGQFEVRGANIVNATGVWADELRRSEMADETELPRIRRAAAPTSPSAIQTCRSSAARSFPPAPGGRSSRCPG